MTAPTSTELVQAAERLHRGARIAFAAVGILALLWIGWDVLAETLPETGPRIRGVTFTGPPSPPLEEEAFTSMARVGADHVALVPEGTIDPGTLEIRHGFEGQWYGETRDAVVEGIRLAGEAGLAVMLKPHLVVGRDPSDPIGRGIWRGDFEVEDEERWSRFATSYRSFLLDYARLAAAEGVELLCVGTELKRIALGRPAFWRELAREVRQVYAGDLVYAANWDSFDRIEFWDALDFIGIDAYFPVSDARLPTPEEIAAGWSSHLDEIEDVHARFDRPVLFTEWGYEAEEYPGREPWLMGGGARGADAGVAQANAYEGTFRRVWGEPWLRGIFVWRWAPRSGEPGTYSPRGREAEAVLRRWFENGGDGETRRGKRSSAQPPAITGGRTEEVPAR